MEMNHLPSDWDLMFLRDVNQRLKLLLRDVEKREKALTKGIKVYTLKRRVTLSEVTAACQVESQRRSQ